MFGNNEPDDTSQQTGQDMTIPADLTDGSMGIPAGQNDTTMLPQPMQSMPAAAPTAPSTAPAADMPSMTPATGSSTTMAMPAPTRAADAGMPEDLINIKQEALQSLKPLVGHLDQSPEEAFRTTMMMIQAADDQSLIPQAYDHAKAITDEKARAQALLDVVNEINYFTAQNQGNQE